MGLLDWLFKSKENSQNGEKKNVAVSKQQEFQMTDLGKYFIISMRGVNVNLNVEAIMIEANPLRPSYGGYMVSELRGKDTKRFMIPLDDRIKNPIIEIANSEGTWIPNISDYVEESIYIEDSDKKSVVYVHKKIAFKETRK